MRCVSLGLLLVASLLSAAEPQWIWSHADAAQDGKAGDVFFRKAFTVAEPQAGELLISADNRFEVFLNGRRIGSGDTWQKRYQAGLKPLLVPGRNLLAVRATNDNDNDPGAMSAQLTVTSKGKPAEVIGSDKTWKFTRGAVGPWHRAEFDDSGWQESVELGAYGKIPPWGAVGTVASFESSAPIGSGKANREPGLFQFRTGDRVTLLGGTFVERMNNYGYFETALVSPFPRLNLSVRNLGWSGDTVWADARGVFGGRNEGFKRLLSDTALTKPTLLILCYGENEAHAGEDGLAEFIQGYGRLLTALEPTGARMLLVSPRMHEKAAAPLPDPAAYNASLLKYRDAIRELAAEREAAFVDLADALANERLTDNGVHLTAFGEWKLANEFVRRLGGKPAEWSVDLDLTKHSLEAVGTSVSEITAGIDRVSFAAVDRTLPRAILAAEEQPAGTTFASPQTLRIRGLPTAKYSIRIDGQEVATAVASDLAAGIALPLPAVKRTEDLRQTILKKNELFFHRYRPQNVTYLFLFRKHEQGNNAVDIPKFDPLVKGLEEQIHAAVD